MAELTEGQESNSLLYLENTLMFLLSPFLILGEVASLSMKCTLIAAKLQAN